MKVESCDTELHGLTMNRDQIGVSSGNCLEDHGVIILGLKL